MNGAEDKRKKARQRGKDAADASLTKYRYIPFEKGRVLGETCRAIAHELTMEYVKETYKRVCNLEDKKHDAEVLCANLLVQKRKRFVAIPMTPNAYIGSELSYSIIGFVHFLKNHGWIEFHQGYPGFEKKGVSGQTTKIRPTQKFLNRFEVAEQMDFGSEKYWLVRLKERKWSKDYNPQYLFYEDTQETLRIREILKKINSVCKAHDIRLPIRNSSKILDTDMHVVFCGSFEEGGRLYTAGRDNYQSALTKDERRKILIDGDETVELDFCGLHPRLLYNEEGIPYGKDPYDVIWPDETALRPLWKTVIFAMVNSESEAEAIKSCNNEINHKGYKTLRRLLHRGTKEKSLEINDLFALVKKAHRPIAHHFCTVACRRLMNTDSKIALEIIEFFTNRDIPILNIHDSFIVQAQYADRLESVMKRAYRHYTGSSVCPIKRT